MKIVRKSWRENWELGDKTKNIVEGREIIDSEHAQMKDRALFIGCRCTS